MIALESIWSQIYWLFIIALPVATIAWTVTHEEVFRELREYCVSRSENGKTIFTRKFFYLFTCEYCFSFYVTALVLLITDFAMLFDDWRGYFISFFAVIWIANVYMSLYALIRTDLKKERVQAKLSEKKLESEEQKKEKN